jgi:hypothetical protein
MSFFNKRDLAETNKSKIKLSQLYKTLELKGVVGQQRMIVLCHSLLIVDLP